MTFRLSSETAAALLGALGLSVRPIDLMQRVEKLEARKR